jgi:hypothetical protein
MNFPSRSTISTQIIHSKHKHSVPHSNPSKPRNPKQKQKEEFEKQTLKLKVLQFSITVISKNVESHNKVTGLRHLDQSPRQQLSARRVQLHPHDHRLATGVAQGLGFPGHTRLQHFLNAVVFLVKSQPRRRFVAGDRRL